MDSIVRLTNDQDGALRRLTFFDRSGMRLSPPYRALKAELRAKDYRAAVRQPWETGVIARV